MKQMKIKTLDGTEVVIKGADGYKVAGVEGQVFKGDDRIGGFRTDNVAVWWIEEREEKGFASTARG